MSINIFSENDSSTNDINDVRYTTKNQNDIEYINTIGDILTGDLHLNSNKLTFDESREQKISDYELGLFKGVKVVTKDGFYVSNRENLTYMGILKNEIIVNKSRITEVGNPIENTDAVNKAYVDSKIDNLTQRYLNYKYINDTFKPTFWVSAFFNQGLLIQDSSTLVNSTNIKEITGNGCAQSGTFTYVNENDVNISLRLNGSNQILSVAKYQNYYTFFLIMKKDLNSYGRLFNNIIENQTFGFMGNQVGNIWLNADVKASFRVNDGKRKFMILRNNNGRKDAWLDTERYLFASRAGDSSWGHGVSIGKNAFNKNALGHMYEVICFDKILNNDDISTISEKLKLYYPFT